MGVKDGYTNIPKNFIRYMKELGVAELKIATSIYLQSALMWHDSQKRIGEVVTTLQKIREYAGYTNANYNINEIEPIIRKLKDTGILEHLEVNGNEVTCRFNFRISYEDGYISIYNKRLMGGKNEKLKDAELRVFMVILSYGQHNTKGIRITEEYISNVLEISEITVKRAIAKLKKSELISVSVENYKGCFKRNIYRIMEQVDKKGKKNKTPTSVRAETEAIIITDEEF